MIGSSCNEKNCPGWAAALLMGVIAYVVVAVMFIKDVYAGPVVVSFERELPNETFYFKGTFEDKDSFEMWLMTRLEDKGCDPYLKNMLIEFKPTEEV